MGPAGMFRIERSWASRAVSAIGTAVGDAGVVLGQGEVTLAPLATIPSTLVVQSASVSGLDERSTAVPVTKVGFVAKVAMLQIWLLLKFQFVQETIFTSDETSAMRFPEMLRLVIAVM